MFKKLAIAFAAIFLAGAAYAASPFDGYPLVGDTTGTTCLSFGNNGVCNQFRPIGPSSLTGNEQYPAANPSGAQSQQTILVPGLLLGAGATQYSVPTTGGTVTVAANTTSVVLDPAGTLATLTINLPAATALQDGQRVRITSSQTITALTIGAGSGTTIAQNPTALTVSTTGSYGYEFVYVASATKWIRLQ